MSTRYLAEILPRMMTELVNGSPDPHARTYILNRGDPGLLASIERLSAAQASAMPHGGGASIAAHVDHLRYGLSLLNRWVATGSMPVPEEVDWTASWKKNVVTDSEWRALRDELRRETDAWIEALRTPRELNEFEAGWVTQTVPHVAYHFGAIRQIDRAARGPSAEDEARVDAELRAR